MGLLSNSPHVFDANYIMPIIAPQVNEKHAEAVSAAEEEETFGGRLRIRSV